MPLSKYFEVVHPQYIYLQLIPIKSTRNYDSRQIPKTISSLYKGFLDRIKKEEKKMLFHTKFKIVFYIYMTKISVKTNDYKVEFYFILPKEYRSLFWDKISDIWQGINIREVEDIPFDNNGIKYAISYKKEDALSLSVDKRSSIVLSVVYDM
jgi:hypothetical protein